MAAPGATSIALIASTLLSTGQAIADLRSDEHHFSVEFPSELLVRNTAQQPEIFEIQKELAVAIGDANASAAVASLKPGVFKSVSRPAVFQIIAASYGPDCGGMLQTKDVTVPGEILRGYDRKCGQPAGVAIKSFPWLADARIFNSFKLLPE